jgi:hypothetical protein
MPATVYGPGPLPSRPRPDPLSGPVSPGSPLICHRAHFDRRPSRRWTRTEIATDQRAHRSPSWHHFNRGRRPLTPAPQTNMIAKFF